LEHLAHWLADEYLDKRGEKVRVARVECMQGHAVCSDGHFSN